MRLASRLLLVLLAVAAPVLAQQADLQAFKADAVDPIAAGGTQTYTITVINNGPDDAEFVSLFDTLPAGTTFLSLSSPAGWTCTTPAVGSGGDVECSTDLLAAFTAPVFTLQVVFDSGLQDGTVVTNSATVSAETPEASPGNETGTTDTTVGTPVDADLSVIKNVAPPRPVLAGTTLTYTITVDNGGPADALAVTLDDPLPAETTFLSLSSPVGWICTTPAVGFNGTVNCSIAILPPGSAVFTVAVQVDPSTPAGTVISNTAAVSSSSPDPDPEDQSSTAFSTVLAPPMAAVTATKTVSGQTQPGGSIVYTIVLTNSGDGAQPDNAGNELTDVLPSELTLVSASATSGAAVATVATNTVTWNGSIPAGGSVTITIQATIEPDVLPGTTISNQASFAFDSNLDGSNESSGVSDDPGVQGSADPTSFVVAGSAVVPIPTLDTLGLLLLTALLALMGAGLLWWRRV